MPMLQYGNAPTAWNASSGDYLTQESAKSLFSQTADEIKTEVTKSVTETVTANVKETATSAANDAVRLLADVGDIFFAADGRVYLKVNEVHIELYTDLKDLSGKR